MAFRKVKDAKGVTGKYIKDGKERNKYVNAGMVLRDDNSGTEIYMCPKSLNPAGLLGRPDSDSVPIYFFNPEDNSKSQPASDRPPQQNSRPAGLADRGQSVNTNWQPDGQAGQFGNFEQIPF